MSSVRAPRYRPDRPAVSGEGEDFPAADTIPDLGRAVQTTRCQLRPVRAPRQRANQPELLRESAFIMSLDAKNLFACGRAPDPDLAVVATRRQTLTVRAPGHGRRPHDV